MRALKFDQGFRHIPSQSGEAAPLYFHNYTFNRTICQVYFPLGIEVEIYEVW